MAVFLTGVRSAAVRGLNSMCGTDNGWREERSMHLYFSFGMFVREHVAE